MNHILVFLCGNEQFTIGNIWGGIIKDKYHTVKTLSISNRNIIERDAKLIPQHPYTHTRRLRGGSWVHTLLCSCLYALVSLCKSYLLLYFVRICFMYYLAYLINVRNVSRRVFVVHWSFDYCRARVVSCYMITKHTRRYRRGSGVHTNLWKPRRSIKIIG